MSKDLLLSWLVNALLTPDPSRDIEVARFKNTMYISVCHCLLGLLMKANEEDWDSSRWRHLNIPSKSTPRKAKNN